MDQDRTDHTSMEGEIQNGSFKEQVNGNNNAVYQQPVQSKQSSMALASLIMGIIGLVTFCVSGGVVFGSLGILFALLSKTEDKFEGYAMAGLITSAIAVASTVLIGILIVFLAIVGIVSGGEF